MSKENQTENHPRENVIASEFANGEGTLVDLNTKRYIQLNETALMIWRCLEQRQSRDEIINQLCARYEVTPEHAGQSVDNAIASFKENELVS